MKRRIEIPHRELLTKQLLGSAKVIVKKGQIVKPDEYIAHTKISAGFRIIPASSYGFSARAVQHSLTRPIGTHIYRGELLIRSRELFGLLEKSLVSPVDGTIYEVKRNGDIVIRYDEKSVHINADVWGTVAEVSEQSVTIATAVARAFGVTGQGKPRGGMVEVVNDPTQFLLPEHITAKLAGHIIVGGRIPHEGTLQKAILVGVSGILVGGMHARVWTKSQLAGEVHDSGITIVLTEGFGQVNIGQDMCAFLNTYAGRYALIDGEEGMLTIPIAPNEETYELKNSQPTLSTGSTVRIIAGTLIGRAGAVKSEPHLTQLASGLSAQAVMIDVGDTIMPIPIKNVEVV